MTISEQAVQAALNAFHDAWNNNAELDNELPSFAMRAALTAAAPHLAAVQVKKLEWRDNEHGSRCVSDQRYNISIWIEGGKPLYVDNYTTMRRFGTLDAAKAAAQADYEARILSALEHLDTLETYYARQIEWSKNTFGPALRTKGIIDHIKKELKEIEAEPHDLSEWIDVVILAMDGFWRHGGTVDDLMPRLLAKQQRNMARTWPDWRTMSEDAAIEHDRSKDAAPSAVLSTLGEARLIELLRNAHRVLGGGGDEAFQETVALNVKYALEEYDARALHPQADKPSDDGAQGEDDLLAKFWRPISEADKSITFEDTYDLGDGKSMTIRNSDHYWVRDADGRVYEATWSDHKDGYWWDIEGESPVDPVEFMPHPLSIPTPPAGEVARWGS